MPLPVAHGLLGASIVAAVLPAPVSARYFKPLLAGAFLANLADFDFLLVFVLHSKHWHRGFTHSIVFALLVGLLFVLYLGKRRLREAAAFGLAFASHCFLDFVTTKEGGGLELLFPFSGERFVGGWFGLSEMPSKLPVFGTLQALAIEFIVFSSLLIIILFLRKSISKKDD
ncbi:MAG TPA: metal-dependent hydrolase [Pyrinomonadaceae bacterium]|nr:metal-dependent hydrolase [Pyrinomonadaceae bacterium]